MFIYITTNLINNKIYIGKHCKTNKNYLGSGILLKQAIKKYGKENFKREIIESEILDYNFLSEREKYWIQLYGSQNRSIGYNLTEGGDGLTNPSPETREKMSNSQTGEKNHNYGNPRPENTKKRIGVGNTGKVRSRETKKILSEINKGKCLSEETRKKMSLAKKGKYFGKNNPMYGKHPSEEAKKKMSNAHSGEKNHNYGKSLSIETKEKISKANKGKTPWNKGKHNKKMKEFLNES